MTRTFTSAPAVRASIPLWIGLYGTSGAGKTYSALRLARGIQSVCGGKIGCGDTENGRASHYADEFDFTLYPFDPPFDPLSYLALLKQMQRDGITVAIIDSASHEHEGEGGLLEMHAAEAKRLAAAWNISEDAAKMSAWIAPKYARRRMIQGAMRLPLHIIWCFRAKEKMDLTNTKKPKSKGFMAIGGDELVYEMALTALLLPGAGGVPTWTSQEQGEKMMIKLPGWAKAMLRSGPLSEDTGAALARWAQGTDAPAEPRPVTGGDLLSEYAQCTTVARLDELEAQRKAAWSRASPAAKRELKAAADTARARLPVLDERQVTDCRSCDFRDDDIDGLGGGAECTLDGRGENATFIDDPNSATPPKWCGFRTRTVVYRLANGEEPGSGCAGSPVSGAVPAASCTPRVDPTIASPTRGRPGT